MLRANLKAVAGCYYRMRKEKIKRLLAVAGDAGGARALLPVVRELKSSGEIKVDCRAYAAAFDIWEKAGFQPERSFPDCFDDFYKIILGTTVGDEMWEPEIVRRARQSNVYTLSVLDFWTNYKERFITDDGEFVLPDAIAVMDELAQEEMLALGFPAQCLHVTGQPAFDEIIKFQESIKKDDLKASENVEGNCLRVLYISQPLSILECNRNLGFDEHQALDDLVTAFNSISAHRAVRTVFSIKPHPCEINPEYPISQELSANLEIEVLSGEVHPYRAVLESDLVVGTNSVLLMEACFLGKPTLSYQPNLQIKDALKSNAFGWSRAVYQQENLLNALEEEIFDAEKRRERRRILANISQPCGAAKRVIKLLLNES